MEIKKGKFSDESETLGNLVWYVFNFFLSVIVLNQILSK